jgi:hypothetical protein
MHPARRGVASWIGLLLPLTLNACREPQDPDAGDGSSVDDGLWDGHHASCNDGAAQAGVYCFESRTLVGALGHPLVADFDGDGYLDLVLHRRNSASGTTALSLMRGDGSGEFEPPVHLLELPSLAPARWLVGDFDGDGDVDILRVGDWQQENLTLLINAGGGEFTPATVEVPSELALRKFAGVTLTLRVEDGRDVLAGTSVVAGEPLILELTVERTVELLGTLDWPAVCWLDGGDFNRDGVDDLLVATGCSGRGPEAAWVGVLLSSADGFEVAAPFEVGANPVVGAPADYDGDGTLDALYLNTSSGDLSFVAGDGLGGFAEQRRLSPSEIGCSTCVGLLEVGWAVNLDGNALADRLVPMTDAEGSLWTYAIIDPLGDAVAKPILAGDDTVVAVADFNGDSLSDILFVRSSAPDSLGLMLSNP